MGLNGYGPKERVRMNSTSSGREGAKVKIMGQIILLLEGSQAMPARPSDSDRMRVKTLG
jgi:hypothetical protein